MRFELPAESDFTLMMDSGEIANTLKHLPGLYDAGDTVTAIAAVVRDGDFEDLLLTYSPSPHLASTMFSWVIRDGRQIPYLDHEFTSLDEARKTIIRRRLPEAVLRLDSHSLSALNNALDTVANYLDGRAGLNIIRLGRGPSATRPAVHHIDRSGVSIIVPDDIRVAMDTFGAHLRYDGDTSSFVAVGNDRQVYWKIGDSAVRNIYHLSAGDRMELDIGSNEKTAPEPAPAQSP